jgi:translation initiation factor IF-3
VPVPRRLDRRPPERDPTRINERIRVPEVRLIGDDGQQIGVVPIDEALRYAQERELDLVEVAPEARPPVTRVLDYSKYKYEQAQKQKAARKHQQQITIREIKFRPKIAQHDYDTKKGHVERFLRHKDKVKITIMFRGREMSHPERGEAILTRLSEELAELAIIEQRPTQDGRNMTMLLGPSRAILAGEAPATDGDKAKAAEPAAATEAAPAEAAAPVEAPAPAAADPSAEPEAEVPAEAPAEPEAEAPAEPEAEAPAKEEPAPEEPPADADQNGEAKPKAAAKKPAAKKPAAKKPAAKKTAAKKAAAEEEPAEEPAPSSAS